MNKTGWDYPASLTFHNGGSLDTNFSLFVWTKLVTILNINNLGKKIYVKVWRESIWSEVWHTQTRRNGSIFLAFRLIQFLFPLFNSSKEETLIEKSTTITSIIIWLAPWAGKMNQIACCDWLPERARRSHLARSGLPAVSRMKNFPESHTINPLLTKFVRSRWLDIGFVLFLRVYGPRLRLGP